MDSNCEISSCFDLFHVTSNFSMFLVHLLVFEHRLEVISSGMLADDSRNASLSAPDEAFNQPCP
jgi:hypothetical protein